MKTKTFGMIIVALVVVVAAVLVVTSRTSSGSASEASSSYQGQVMAPADFSVADYAGKPLVVNMFGSWCPPCNLEAPDLGTFAQQNADVQVVGVACEDTEKDATAFMTKYGLTYPLVIDDGSITSDTGITAYPTTIFYDAQGNEVDRLVGASTLDQFNASLAKVQ